MLLSDDIDKNPEKYDCNICRQRKYYLEKNCTGEKIPKMNLVNEEVKFIVDQDVKTRTEIALNFCPAILFHDEEVMELLELYSFYKDGFLLKEGSLENQPYWYLYAMSELKSVNNYIEKKQLEKVNG